MANEYITSRFNREMKFYYSDDDEDDLVDNASSTIPLPDKKEETSS